MKNLFSILFTILLITLLSCSKNEKTAKFAFGDLFELNFAEQKTSDDGTLSVDFRKIEDSRCPLNVECVWEGQAEVSLSVTASEEEAQNLLLILRVGHEELAVDTLGNFIYTLIDVLPYPEDPGSIDDEDYLIKLKIDEL